MILPDPPQKPNKKDPTRDSYTGDPTAELAFRRGFHHAAAFVLTYLESLPDRDGLAEIEADVYVWEEAVARWRDKARLDGDYSPEGTPMPGGAA